MKKLFSMMLMLCAVVTFTACSGDEGEEDKSPISNVVLPSSAQIGSSVTILGKGFTASQKFYLTDADNSSAFPIELENVGVTSDGITFTVPYTLTEGMTAKLVVNDNGKEWTVGTMTILAADNPVSAVSIPSQMPLLSDVTIVGTGFADGDVVSIAANDDDEKIKLDTKVSAEGVVVNTSTALEGEVNVYLHRGNSVWKIGQTYAYFERYISNITISDNYIFSMYAAYGYFTTTDGSSDMKLGMEYDENGALQAVTTNVEDLKWTLSYSGNTVSFEGQMNGGAPYTYTLDDQNRIVSSTGQDAYTGDEVTYTWTYDADGYLVKIASADETLLDVCYEDNNMKSYTFVIACGTNSENTLHAYPATVEPAFLLNAYTWITAKEDLFIGFLLNRNVKISSYVLSQFSAEDYNADMTDTEVKSFAVASNTKEIDTYKSSLTLQTSGSDYISGMGGLYHNKVDVIYTIREK